MSDELNYAIPGKVAQATDEELVEQAAALMEQIRTKRECICVPCTTPAYGAPGHDHCAACCAGTMIAEYDHACPVPEHRELAVAQWGAIEPSENTG